MFKWILNLFKPKSLKENENYNSVDDSDNLTVKTVVEVVEDNSTLGIQSLLEDEEQPSNVFETTVIPIQKTDSIYEMHRSEVSCASYDLCYLSSYTIKGYTKYTTTEVAGPQYHRDAVSILDTIIREYESVYICAYCEKEPDNPHDSNAAKVLVDVMDNYDTKTFHIGYLPKEVAKYFKDIDDIPVIIRSIKLSTYTDVCIDVYVENSVYQRTIKEKERLLGIKKKYDNNSSKINKLIEDGDILEKNGSVDEAMEKFKQALDLGCVMPHPTNRLMIYYRKKRDYNSEMAVISQFLEQNVYRLDDDYYKERLTKAKELKQKQIEKEAALNEKARIKKEKEELRNAKALETEQKKKELQAKREQSKNTTSKICSCCKQEKSVEYFNKNGKDSKGNTVYRSRCKECIKASKK